MRRLGMAGILLLGCSTLPPENPTNRSIEPAVGPPELLGSNPSPSHAEGVSAGETAKAQGHEAHQPEPGPTAVPPTEPVPLPPGTVVLHVGSSTAAALGADLRREFEERDIKYILKSQQSTFIKQWAGEEMGLGRLVANYNPDLVLISLGGNEASTPNPPIHAGAIRRIVKMIGERPCLWIGTPRWKALEHTGILEVIQENAAPCHYFDTDALVPDLEPLSDGVHPTVPERRRWALSLIEWLEHSRDPEGERPWSLKAASSRFPPPTRLPKR